MRSMFFIVVVVLCTTGTADAQPVADLIEQLQSPTAAARRIAAEKLGKQKAEAASKALADLLKDKEYAVSHAAAAALVRIGPRSVAPLTSALKMPEERAKLQALWALSKLGAHAAEARSALLVALKDEAVDVRIHAAFVLGKTKDKEALPALFQAATDMGNLGSGARSSDVPMSVAETAIKAAIDIDPQCITQLAKTALPALIKGLQSKEEPVVMAAIRSVRLLGPHASAALPALDEVRKSADDAWTLDDAGEVMIAIGGDGMKWIADLVKDARAPLKQRVNALEVLGRSRTKDDKAFAIVIDALKRPEPELRAAAAEAVSWIGTDAKAAIPALIELLADDALDEAARKRRLESDNLVVRALAGIGAEAVPALVNVLKMEDSKFEARWHAAETLAQLGRKAKSSLVVLEGRLNDESPAIAIKSALAYVRAGGNIDLALPVLNNGLQHNSDFVVRTAASAIERIGPRAKDAVPRLLPLLKHKDREVRIVAARALAKMGPAGAAGVPQMAKLLEDGDERQRYQVGAALAELGIHAREALPVLMEQLKNLENVHPNSTLTMLERIGPEAKTAVPVLIELLKQETTELHHGQIMEVLGKIGPDAAAAVPDLVAALGKSSEFNRAYAARSLGGIGPRAKDAVPALKKLLEDESLMVRIWAACALAQVTGEAKSPVAFMIDLWQDELDEGPFSGMTRAYIIQALEVLGPEARPGRDLLLEALFSDKTGWGTHHHVARALGQLRDDAAVIVPRLIALTERKAFNDREGMLYCTHAIEALDMLGPLAKEAIPRLQQLVLDDDNDIAEAAEKTLAKLQAR